MKNKVMLITYPNSIGKDLKDLEKALNTDLKGLFGGIHILPFYPSSADRGFAPMSYRSVDPVYGSFDDLKRLGDEYELMYDFMINHISRSSEYFKDFIKNKEASPYYDLFIKFSDFWENGLATQEQIDLIYKRKPKEPAQVVEFEDGTTDKVWTTFDEEQVDLDIRKAVTKKFIKENLEFLCDNGAKIIRADAFAYVTKKQNTNCFFVEPDTWDILAEIKEILNQKQVELLPEIHEHYSIQKRIADHGYYVYDFALPMLVLHALYSGKANRLIDWIKISPRNQFTTLDTHDGIGVVDVKDLMDDDEINFTKEALFSKGANVKRIYNTTAYNNLDIYQLNCTYYSALGDDDKAYLLARAIQFFTPGIPQVYYVGALCGKNDIELLESTKNGRDINRHNYSLDEISEEVERPVVQSLFKLMRFRNDFEAFDGEFCLLPTEHENELRLSWSKDGFSCVLKADLSNHDFIIEYAENNKSNVLTL
ncbi:MULTISPECIES: sucrose phosphorylase [unclassified Fusibacter]|uniref:sucrose phosphorylase n=1 Tax=unclassified Fusibacter TaxID=2624464 RepID=UPI0010123C13|nr:MULTISPECIES: sucrose phosphorylase [unclassified Fusibacter]MCK8060455.1 sucrose phosphorylase [Fusibacter sp. A2]NPE20256.1 sucrose phosphorylase [Fusibacter sp. A1]RXV63463.1 sucrose phosphorylase [Fusibacter sp. A1]